MQKYYTQPKKIILSLFGIGYLPLSGMWSVIISSFVLFFIWPELNLLSKTVIMMFTFLIGWHFSNCLKLKDPSWVVIDELLGVMITTLFLDQSQLWPWMAAIILFGGFDFLKLWPASYFDRQHGGFGIMMDDVVMAIPSLVFLHLILNIL